MEEPTYELTKGPPMKVVQLGLESRVYAAMKTPRFSIKGLVRELASEGIKITAPAIGRFIKKTHKAQRELISSDLRAAEEYRQLTMNYDKALRDILNEVEEVKKTAKNERNFAIYNQLVGRLMQGIELVAKLSGDLRPDGSTDIKLIYQEINLDTERKMKDIKRDLFKCTPIDVDAEIKKNDSIEEIRINKND